MKTRISHSLEFSKRVLVAVVGLSAGTAAAATNSWNTGAGLWDGGSANWLSPPTWTTGDDAVFSNTAVPSTVTLSSGLIAGSVTIGNGTNNANYTFTGSDLTATRFTVQGNPANDLTTNPTATLYNATLTLSGDLGVGRAYLNISGGSSIIADRIGGGGMTGISSADWGVVSISGSANVTATNGVVGGTTAWGLNLNGGTLTTKGINYGPHFHLLLAGLNFNGTLVKANQNNSNFVTYSGGDFTAPDIQAGGAKIDTNGYDIGIQISLAGVGALTKSGGGTLSLSGAANTFNGGVTVHGGTLLLEKGADVDSIAAGNAVVVNSGGTIKLGANRGQINDSIASLTLNGGTFDLSGQIEGINPAITLAGGTITGTSAGYLLARGGYAGTGTNSISQRLSVRAVDANSGKFNITSGTTTVSGAIYTDSGGNAGISKTGNGTLVLSNNSNGYAGNTTVSEGTLLLLNGDISMSSLTTVAAGATFGGTGTVGATSVSGTFAPGNSIGTINVGMTLDLAGISNFEIDPTTGSGFDRIADLANVSGVVTYGGILNVIYGGPATNFTEGMVFNLFDATSFTGSFTTVNLPTLGGGLFWEDNLLSNGTMVVIPESGPMLLGLLGLFTLSRRRR